MTNIGSSFFILIQIVESLNLGISNLSLQGDPYGLGQPLVDICTRVALQHRAGQPIIRKVLKIRIWVVPPVCLGSR